MPSGVLATPVSSAKGLRMSVSKKDLLQRLPAVNSVLEDEQLRRAAAGVPHAIVAECVRSAVEEVKRRLLAGGHADRDEDAIYEIVRTRAVEAVQRAGRTHYRKVINGTGIILHTGLGRAVLAPRALEHLQKHLAGYSLLQLDPETGKRCRRDARIEWLLRRLTGAEAATVVNNNAAATLIVLNTVAEGREVIVSRGQLVEIGGSFRLPDVMEESGARLVEVGTTNKTHLPDYERAVTEDTAAILRVHPSNYKIAGFSSEVPLEDLEKLAHANDLVLIDDVGAGGLMDFSRFGFEKEPSLPESVETGADLIISSGDKLIGAAQAGVILGRSDLVEAIRRNPLARILRVDKMALAVLEATLTLWLDEEAAMEQIPTLRMLRRDLDEVTEQAERIAAAVRERVPPAADRVGTAPGHSQMGSGSLPTQNLPTRLVAAMPGPEGAEALARRLRRWDPPVFGRIREETVLIDPRTLLEGDEQTVIDALAGCLAEETAES